MNVREKHNNGARLNCMTCSSWHRSTLYKDQTEREAEGTAVSLRAEIILQAEDNAMQAFGMMNVVETLYTGQGDCLKLR